MIKERLLSFWKFLKADRKRLVFLIAFVAALFIIGLKIFSGSQQKTTYQTSKVTRGKVVSSVSVSGQILTSNLFNINTQATGVVKAVYVKNGDKVYAGEKIAEITLDSDGELASAKAWASLVSANNALNAAKNNYRLTQASLQNVYDQVKGHGADETFVQRETRTKAEVANDNAYDAVKTGEANLSSAQLAFRTVSPAIFAPASGVIDSITFAAGMVLSGPASASGQPSSRLASIRSFGKPMATFNVSEVDVNRVTPGQKAEVILDSIPGKTFRGTILTVDKIGTVSSGVTNYPVVIGLDTDSSEVLPNMAATGSIVTASREDVLLIPSEAIQNIRGSNFVRVLINGVPKEIKIETGLSSDTQTEIIEGLDEGDLVITGASNRGNPNVRNGATSPFSTFRIGGAGGLRTGGGGR